MIKYVIDEVISSVQRQIWSETLIVEKKMLPGFLPSRELDESTALFRDVGLNDERHWSATISANAYVNASLKSLLGAHSQLGGPWATKIFFGKCK